MNTTTATRPISTATRPTCAVTRPQRLPASFYKAIEVPVPESVLAEAHAHTECDEPGLIAEEMGEAMNPFQLTISNRIATGPVTRIRVIGRGAALYSVPSESLHQVRYMVETVEHRVNSCTCPDWRRNSYYHRHVCKHMRAVEMFVFNRLLTIKGELETEVVTAIADHDILQTLCDRYGLAVYDTELYLSIQNRLHTKRESLLNGMRYLSDPIPAK